ncbi:MAG: glycosyltransferase family 4 protein [Ramlibacter sp.]|nr:glycosyltransferase family 4 protein [Ramlibacter sp.]
MLGLALIGFAVSLLACLALIRHARRHAQRYATGLPQRFHLGHVPRIGGVAIYAGIVAGTFAAPALQGMGLKTNVPVSFMNWALWCLVLLPIVAGGVYEDFSARLSAKWRLSITVCAAAFACWCMELQVPRLGVAWIDPFWVAMPFLGIGLALLGIAGLPHAFNIIDGFNGLAGTVATLICLALAHVSLQVGDRQMAAFMMVTVGATGGFLYWNYPRGLLFAGDGGAYLWGGVIALAAVLLVQRHADISPWFPMLLTIYPVWEVIFSTYRKMSRGVSPTVPDSIHFHMLIYRRIVRGVFHDDETRRMLVRNNRTSPYLWGFTLLTVVPAVLFWNNTPVLMAFTALFVISYLWAYFSIVRFKVPSWLRR